MSEQFILKKFNSMPDRLKQEVVDFMEYLALKYEAENKPKIVPKFGSAKGKYTLAPDFDEPLEDFKDYM